MCPSTQSVFFSKSCVFFDFLAKTSFWSIFFHAHAHLSEGIAHCSSCSTMTQYPSYYLGFNQIRCTCVDGELQIETQKGIRFCIYENGDTFLAVFTTFWPNPKFSCEEIFTNGLRQRPSWVLLCWARQKYCRCCSSFGVGSVHEKWYPSDAEKWSPNFFREPQTHMYRSI